MKHKNIKLKKLKESIRPIKQLPAPTSSGIFYLVDYEDPFSEPPFAKGNLAKLKEVWWKWLKESSDGIGGYALMSKQEYDEMRADEAD